MSSETQAAILALAARVGAYVISDEVYRGAQLDQDSPAGDAPDCGPVRLPDSVVQLDPERGISVGSMSKAFAMAGVRLGWVVAPKDVLREVRVRRGQRGNAQACASLLAA